MNVFSFFRALISRSLIVLALAPAALWAAMPLNINAASADQLAAVMSGVGEKKAQAIIDYRDAHDGFTSLDELVKVKGIGDVLLERNKDVLQVAAPSGDQNDSSQQ